MNKKIKKVHFVGVKGVGMAPLAIIAKQAGFTVTGCDVDQEFITDKSLQKEGINAFSGFDSAHVKNCDLIITTGAHGGFDNPENVKAKDLGISIWSQGEAVGEFMSGEIFGKKLDGVSVSGSHGKTTVTAIIATILMENKMDPSFLIGTGSIKPLGAPGHFGKGKYFVAEADEYATEPKYDSKPKLLWQKPKIGVITNIEFDHPDVFHSIDDLKDAFLNFANNIDLNGTLVACVDDREVSSLLTKYERNKVTYGFSKSADYYIERVSIEPDKSFFWVSTKKTLLGQFMINLVGEHNILNALASIVVCLELGLSIESIKKGLSSFMGTKRRFEYFGKLSTGAVLYDDYAHHPTEIKKTLIAFRQKFPNKKIVCVFQPHTYSRTKSLFEEFISSFGSANEIVFVDIYPSLREEIDKSVSSQLLADRVSKIHGRVEYVAKLEDVVKYLGQKRYDENYVIVTMGAGDVYQVAEQLLKQYGEIHN